jgi:hypothetical protein
MPERKALFGRRRRTPDECPRCGAPLPAPAAGIALRSCSYCHTTVEVPESAPLRLTPLKIQLNRAVALVSLLTAVGLVLAGVLSASRLRRGAPASLSVSTLLAPAVSSTTAEAPPPEPPCERLRALSGLVLVEQGDKADAFMLVIEPFAAAAGQRRLSLRDPASGRELWNRPLEFEGSGEQLLSIPLGETLVVAMPNRIWGLDPENGQPSWERATTIGPAERTRACTDGRDFGFVDDEQRFERYSIITGSPVPPQHAGCVPTYDSHAEAPNFAFVAPAVATRWLPPGDGFGVTRGLLPSHGTAEVVLGTEPSAGSASVGVLTGRRWLWQANVANEAPSSARFTTPALAAVRQERVVVPYLSDGRVALTGLELTSGERRWTTVLPAPADVTGAPAPEGEQSELVIARAGHAAYRAPSGDLTVLNLDTGAIEWTLACKE